MTSDPNEPSAPAPAPASSAEPPSSSEQPHAESPSSVAVGAAADVGSNRPVDARTKKVLAIVVGAYALGLVMLVALDQVAVVWKSLVVPGVALAAALTGRLREFVRDWAVFLAAVVLFDASRGFVYALILRFDLPVYMAYAIDAEKALFGEPLLTAQVQGFLSPDGRADAFDKILAIIYGSHFVLFLLYGLAIWLTRARDFGRFKLSMLLVMYLGVIGYLLVPTVPPWMAASTYFVIPKIQEIGAQLFHASLPTISTAFELNPIAAMPSLHCAFPTLLTMITFRHFRAWGALMLAYTLLVYLATIQLGHHYAVDVLGGIALAAIAYGIVYGGDRVARALGALRTPGLERAVLRKQLLATGLLLSLTLLEGAYGPMIAGQQPPVPSAEFIERELEGKSPMASYYRGLRAFRAKNHVLAQHWLARAVPEVPPSRRESAITNLAVTAYLNDDYRTVVWASRRLSTGFPTPLALMIAKSMVRTGEQREGFELLDRVAAKAPDDPYVKQVVAELAPLRHGT
jgi:membrane-associated phospholipid phosphatase